MEEPIPRPAPEGSKPGEPSWKSVLGDGSPREILARVVEGDPLDLRARCELRVRSQAVLVDVHRLHLRTAAHVARHGREYKGSPPLEIWLAEQIRNATRELLREEAERAASGDIPEAPEDDRLLLIADTLGIDTGVIGRGCVAFNRARYEVRAAFYGLVLEAQDPTAWCTANSTTIERATSSLRAALYALGVRETPDLDAWLRGGDDEP